MEVPLFVNFARGHTRDIYYPNDGVDDNDENWDGGGGGDGEDDDVSGVGQSKTVQQKLQVDRSA